jgi:copper chaperone NosL
MKKACSCRRQSGPSDSHPGVRRHLLGLIALISVGAMGALPGCGDRTSDIQALTPVEIGAATTCVLDGMLLTDYPGPKAQIFYAGAIEPEFMCDTVEMFNTLLRPEQMRKVVAVYVQDMGKADWDQPRGNWMDASVGFYVLGGKRHGSMGPTIASFSQESDAQKFLAQWGGKVVRYSDIKPDMVDLSGGALHDTRM